MNDPNPMLMNSTAPMEMASHWLFPAFFGIMTLVIAIVFIRGMFLTKGSDEKSLEQITEEKSAADAPPPPPKE